MSCWSSRLLVLVWLPLASIAVSAQQPSPEGGRRGESPLLAPPAEPGPDLAAIKLSVTIMGGRLDALHELVEKIERQTRPPTFLGRAVDAFAINTLWEFFGFSPSEKSVFGMAFSILGIIGVGVKLLLRAGGRTWRWLDAALFVYLALCVLTLGAFSYSNHVSTTQAASVEPDLRVEMRQLQTELAGFRTALNAELTRVPPAGSSSGELSRIEQGLKELGLKLVTVTTEAQNAAIGARTAAEDISTGWGWHVFILMLLMAVIALQAVQLLREQ